MTTSGSTNFSENRNAIMQEAYELGGVVRAGQAINGAQVTKASRVLNAMVKSWMASGIHIWTVSEAVLIPQATQVQYALGSTSTDHATLKSDYVETTLSADEAVGQTVLSVTATGDIAISDKFGILLDDGTVQWSTVSNKSSTTVTIADALTDSAGSGAKIFTYTNALVRPIKIVAIRRKNLDSGYETNLTRLERLDYQALANKSSQGLPSQYFYDPQLALGQLYIYQRESLITEILNLTFHRPIEDFDSAADDPDLPQEWIKALNYGLALDLGDSYDIPEQRYTRIAAQFAATMSALSGFDREEGSIFLQPDME